MMRTANEYRASLRDGRTVYFNGERIPDVTSHPVLRVAVDHAALDYEMAEDDRYRRLAVAPRPGGGEMSRFFVLPASADDLLARMALIETGTQLGGTVPPLIKEIGTDALFALHLVADEVDRERGTRYGDRVQAFFAHCRDEDLAMAVAQTDVKGDRGAGPTGQAHPDYYLRIVEERADGIVVRGAKAHTSVSMNANEMIVLPTRALGERDGAYAVAFAIPVATPGLRLIVSPYGGQATSTFERPLSSRHRMMESLTVFDDVVVPRERVFLQGEWEYAGPLARTFVEYHRFTAVSYKLPLVDLLVGAAQLIAEYNGIDRAAHVRDKITWLAAYAQTLRSLVRMAAYDCARRARGLAVPDPATVNIAKLYFASQFHTAVAYVQEIAGGLLVTSPGEADWRSPETRPFLERYLGGKGVGADARLRLLHLITDVTTAELGGYHAVLAIHAEGSIEAEKMTIHRTAPLARCVALAKELAGISE
ncbi:MAG TPA: 4-hydroxyphenylacetate 3-hydroxylase N-terminal domain-containing protein [bacterium]|nr:4-hydroxyphenylacetate 3-hydroxylase N-terminal domain-containing protein [bacterium]